MTDYKKYINALRKCAKEHEDDRASFGHIIVSDLCRDTANLLEKLEQEPRWIPVSERLPDKLNDVLITFYDCPNEYDVAYLRTTFNESYKKSGAKNEWVSSMGETTYADYEVDAWMPIHPYKLESEDKE